MELLKREHISDQLFEIIGNQIIRNELKPGESIYETQLSKSYGISRSPVRDALHSLEQVRLVERTERGTYRVTELTTAFVDDLYDTVTILLKYAFSTAAARALPEDLRHIHGLMQVLDKSIAQKDFECYLKKSTELIEKLMRLSGNMIIEKIALGLMPSAERLQWSSITCLPDHLHRVVHNLKTAISMVACNKPDHASLAVERFIRAHKSLVMKIVGDRLFADSG
jgi:DNA-binding GntR family transcriptional regulator